MFSPVIAIYIRYITTKLGKYLSLFLPISIALATMIRIVRRQHEKISLLKKRNQIFKRAFDLTFCCLALPFALPLIGLCALAIRLESSGQIIFTQLRTGKGGRRFRMYKFRTMVKNAEELKEQLQHLNELTPPDFKMTNDPRITTVGKFLRKTSLDELPQIFNVLKGDMSVVGPRPTSFDASTYTLEQTERLEVMPGVTGLWQISGRSDIDFHERVRLDAEYIKKQSFWFDLKIIALTFAVVLKQKGAC